MKEDAQVPPPDAVDLAQDLPEHYRRLRAFESDGNAFARDALLAGWGEAWLRRAFAAEARVVELVARVAELEAMVAWANGDLSEGQFCALTGMDAVDARDALNSVLTSASQRWADWRASNAPSRG